MKVDDTTKLSAILHPRTANALATAGLKTLGDVKTYQDQTKLASVKYVTVRTVDTLLSAIKTGEAKPFKVERKNIRVAKVKPQNLSGLPAAKALPAEKFTIPLSMVRSVNVRTPAWITGVGALEFELTPEGVALFGRDIISKLYQASRR